MTKKRYYHGLTIAFWVDSNSERMPTVEEALAGLMKRTADLLEDRKEAKEALLTEMPFTSHENDE